MAILGFHIVLSLIAASVLQKLSARFSAGRKFLSKGLFRYLHPTTEELKVASGHAPAAKGGAKKRRNNDHKGPSDAEGFLIPKSTELSLETVEVQPLDLIPLPFYIDYRWMIDFALAALTVYLFTELYSWILPRRCAAELNLSIIWCLVLLGLCLKSLATLSSSYFTSVEDTGERSLVLCFGAIIFLFSIMFLIVAERTFDIGFINAYENFTSNTNQFLKDQHVDIMHNNRSPILLFVVIAVLFGVVGGLLVFPAFRYARMYTDALTYSSRIGQLFLHISFFLPLFIIALWIKPLAQGQLVDRQDPLLNLEQLESIRLWAVIIFVILRVLTARMCLQAYLNVAHQKITLLNKEAGRINSLEIQRMVARIFFYLCGAASQYFSPVIMMLATVCILKTQGNYSWLSAFNVSSDPPIKTILPFDTVASKAGLANTVEPMMGTDEKDMMSIYSLFNPVVNRGIWSLILVASCIVNFSLNLIGVVYNSRFDK